MIQMPGTVPFGVGEHSEVRWFIVVTIPVEYEDW